MRKHAGKVAGKLPEERRRVVVTQVSELKNKANGADGKARSNTHSQRENLVVLSSWWRKAGVYVCPPTTFTTRLTFYRFLPSKKKKATNCELNKTTFIIHLFFFLHTIMGSHTSNGTKVTKISEDGFLSTGSSKGVWWNAKLSSRWSSWKWDLKCVFGNHEYDISSSQSPNISLFHPNIRGNDRMHKLLL